MMPGLQTAPKVSITIHESEPEKPDRLLQLEGRILVRMPGRQRNWQKANALP